MSKKYDIDFKESVIAFYREVKKVPNAKAFRDTIKRFGLNHQTLSRWIREYEVESMELGAPPVRLDLRQSNINYNEKWDKYREENARDDYDHISEWGVLVTTELIFLLTLCHSHIRHAGGKARKDIDDIIFKLKYQLRNS